MKKTKKVLTTFILCYALLLQSQLLAVEVIVKLKAGRNFRKYDVNEKGVKYLSTREGRFMPRGSKLRIPLEELTDKNGIDRYKTMNKKEREKAVIKWLQNPKWAKLQTFDFRASGKPKRDFFLKVKTQDGEEGYMQLKTLALSQGLDLITVEDDILLPEESPDLITGATDSSQDSDFSQNACVETLPPSVIDLLSNDALDAAKVVEKEMLDKAKEGLLRTTPRATVRNFNSEYGGCYKYLRDINQKYCEVKRIFKDNCFKETRLMLPFDKFKEIMKIEGKRKGVPYDLMLSLMSQESSGRCVANANDSGASTGLFQINILNSLPSPILRRHCPYIGECSVRPDVTDVKKCEREVAKKRCLNTLKEVISNPVLNLELSLNLLRQKYLVHSGEKPKRHNKQSFELLTDEEKDYWRMTLSAYNGGPTHVKNAKSHIEYFNQKNGTSLNPKDWKTRRAFLLKNLMSAQYEYKKENKGNIVDACENLFHGNQTDLYLRSREFKDQLKSSKAFGSSGYTDWRHVCFARINVSFVDTIVGTGFLGDERSRIDEWNDYLK